MPRTRPAASGSSFLPFSVCSRLSASSHGLGVNSTPTRSGLLTQQVAGDDDAHDLVGAFEDLVDAQVAQIALDREILEVAVAAMQLQRLVGDMETGIGREALGHRAVQGRLGVAAVQARRRAP